MIMLETMGATLNSQLLMNIGMFVSMTSMSFAKRFMIRPSGVVSKKDMGACMMRLSNPLWMVREANTQPTARAMDSTAITKAEINKRPMDLDTLFDNTDKINQHIIMYDKHYRTNHIKCYKVKNHSICISRVSQSPKFKPVLFQAQLFSC